MPACFQLINKETNVADTFQAIDAALCTEFDKPCDDDKYLYSWYNFIGLCAATGKSFEDMRNALDVDDDQLCYDIIDYLDEHYTINAWHER